MPTNPRNITLNIHKRSVQLAKQDKPDLDAAFRNFDQDLTATYNLWYNAPAKQKLQLSEGLIAGQLDNDETRGVIVQYFQTLEKKAVEQNIEPTLIVDKFLQRLEALYEGTTGDRGRAIQLGNYVNSQLEGLTLIGTEPDTPAPSDTVPTTADAEGTDGDDRGAQKPVHSPEHTEEVIKAINASEPLIVDAHSHEAANVKPQGPIESSVDAPDSAGSANPPPPRRQGPIADPTYNPNPHYATINDTGYATPSSVAYSKYTSNYLSDLVNAVGTFRNGRVQDITPDWLDKVAKLQSYADGPEIRFAREIGISRQIGYFEPDLVKRLNEFRSGIEDIIGHKLSLPSDAETPPDLIPGHNVTRDTRSLKAALLDATRYYEKLDPDQKAIANGFGFTDESKKHLFELNKELVENPDSLGKVTKEAFAEFIKLDKTVSKITRPDDIALRESDPTQVVLPWVEDLTSGQRLQRIQDPSFEPVLLGADLDRNPYITGPAAERSFKYAVATNIPGFDLGYDTSPEQANRALQVLQAGLTDKNAPDRETFAKQVYTAGALADRNTDIFYDIYNSENEALVFGFDEVKSQTGDKTTLATTTLSGYNDKIGSHGVVKVSLGYRGSIDEGLANSYHELSHAINLAAFAPNAAAGESGDQNALFLTPDRQRLVWGHGVEERSARGTQLLGRQPFALDKDVGVPLGWINENTFHQLRSSPVSLTYPANTVNKRTTATQTFYIPEESIPEDLKSQTFPGSTENFKNQYEVFKFLNTTQEKLQKLRALREVITRQNSYDITPENLAAISKEYTQLKAEIGQEIPKISEAAVLAQFERSQAYRFKINSKPKDKGAANGAQDPSATGEDGQTTVSTPVDPNKGIGFSNDQNEGESISEKTPSQILGPVLGTAGAVQQQFVDPVQSREFAKGVHQALIDHYRPLYENDPKALAAFDEALTQTSSDHYVAIHTTDLSKLGKPFGLFDQPFTNDEVRAYRAFAKGLGLSADQLDTATGSPHDYNDILNDFTSGSSVDGESLSAYQNGKAIIGATEQALSVFKQKGGYATNLLEGLNNFLKNAPPETVQAFKDDAGVVSVLASLQSIDGNPIEIDPQVRSEFSSFLRESHTIVSGVNVNKQGQPIFFDDEGQQVKGIGNLADYERYQLTDGSTFIAPKNNPGAAGYVLDPDLVDKLDNSGPDDFIGDTEPDDNVAAKFTFSSNPAGDRQQQDYEDIQTAPKQNPSEALADALQQENAQVADLNALRQAALVSLTDITGDDLLPKLEDDAIKQRLSKFDPSKLSEQDQEDFRNSQRLFNTTTDQIATSNAHLDAANVALSKLLKPTNDVAFITAQKRNAIGEILDLAKQDGNPLKLSDDDISALESLGTSDQVAISNTPAVAAILDKADLSDLTDEKQIEFQQSRQLIETVNTELGRRQLTGGDAASLLAGDKLGAEETATVEKLTSSSLERQGSAKSAVESVLDAATLIQLRDHGNNEATLRDLVARSGGEKAFSVDTQLQRLFDNESPTAIANLSVKDLREIINGSVLGQLYAGKDPLATRQAIPAELSASVEGLEDYRGQFTNPQLFRQFASKWSQAVLDTAKTVEQHDPDVFARDFPQSSLDKVNGYISAKDTYIGFDDYDKYQQQISELEGNAASDPVINRAGATLTEKVPETDYGKYASEYVSQLTQAVNAYRNPKLQSPSVDWLNKVSELDKFADQDLAGVARDTAIGIESGKFTVTLPQDLRDLRHHVEDVIGEKLTLGVDKQTPVNPPSTYDPAADAQSLSDSIDKALEYWNGLSGDNKVLAHRGFDINPDDIQYLNIAKEALTSEPAEVTNTAPNVFEVYNKLDKLASHISQRETSTDTPSHEIAWDTGLNANLQEQRLSSHSFEPVVIGQSHLYQYGSDLGTKIHQTDIAEYAAKTNIPGVLVGSVQRDENQDALNVLAAGLGENAEKDGGEFVRRLVDTAAFAQKNAQGAEYLYEAGDTGIVVNAFHETLPDLSLGRPSTDTTRILEHAPNPNLVEINLPVKGTPAQQVEAFNGQLSHVQTLLSSENPAPGEYQVTLNGQTVHWDADTEKQLTTDPEYKAAPAENIQLPDGSTFKDLNEAKSFITEVDEKADHIRLLKNGLKYPENLTDENKTAIEQAISDETTALKAELPKYAEAQALLPYSEVADPATGTLKNNAVTSTALAGIRDNLRPELSRFKGIVDLTELTGFVKHSAAVAYRPLSPDANPEAFNQLLDQFITLRNEAQVPEGEPVVSIDKVFFGNDDGINLTSAIAVRRFAKELGLEDKLSSAAIGTESDYANLIQQANAGADSPVDQVAVADKLVKASNSAVNAYGDRGGDLTPLASALNDFLANGASEVQQNEFKHVNGAVGALAKLQEVDGNRVSIDADVRQSLSDQLGVNSRTALTITGNEKGSLQFAFANGQRESVNAPINDHAYGLTDGSTLYAGIGVYDAALTLAPKLSERVNWLDSAATESEPQWVRYAFDFAKGHKTPEEFAQSLADKLARFSTDGALVPDPESQQAYGALVAKTTQYIRNARSQNNPEAVQDFYKALDKAYDGNLDNFYQSASEVASFKGSTLDKAFPDLALSDALQQTQADITQLETVQRAAQHGLAELTGDPFLKTFFDPGFVQDQLDKFDDTSLSEQKLADFKSLKSLYSSTSDAIANQRQGLQSALNALTGKDTALTPKTDTTDLIGNLQQEARNQSRSGAATGEINRQLLLQRSGNEQSSQVFRSSINDQNIDTLENYLNQDQLETLVKNTGGADNYSVSQQITRLIETGGDDVAGSIDTARLNKIIDLATASRLHAGATTEEAVGSIVPDLQATTENIDKLRPLFKDDASFEKFTGEWAKAVLDTVPAAQSYGADFQRGFDPDTWQTLQGFLDANKDDIGDSYNHYTRVLDSQANISNLTASSGLDRLPHVGSSQDNFAVAPGAEHFTDYASNYLSQVTDAVEAFRTPEGKTVNREYLDKVASLENFADGQTVRLAREIAVGRQIGYFSEDLPARLQQFREGVEGIIGHDISLSIDKSAAPTQIPGHSVAENKLSLSTAIGDGIEFWQSLTTEQQKTVADKFSFSEKDVDALSGIATDLRGTDTEVTTAAKSAFSHLNKLDRAAILFDREGTSPASSYNPIPWSNNLTFDVAKDRLTSENFEVRVVGAPHELQAGAAEHEAGSYRYVSRTNIPGVDVGFDSTNHGAVESAEVINKGLNSTLPQQQEVFATQLLTAGELARVHGNELDSRYRADHEGVIIGAGDSSDTLVVKDDASGETRNSIQITVNEKAPVTEQLSDTVRQLGHAITSTSFAPDPNSGSTLNSIRITEDKSVRFGDGIDKRLTTGVGDFGDNAFASKPTATPPGAITENTYRSVAGIPAKITLEPDHPNTADSIASSDFRIGDVAISNPESGEPLPKGAAFKTTADAYKFINETQTHLQKIRVYREALADSAVNDKIDPDARADIVKAIGAEEAIVKKSIPKLADATVWATHQTLEPGQVVESSEILGRIGDAATAILQQFAGPNDNYGDSALTGAYEGALRKSTLRIYNKAAAQDSSPDFANTAKAFFENDLRSRVSLNPQNLSDFSHPAGIVDSAVDQTHLASLDAFNKALGSPATLSDTTSGTKGDFEAVLDAYVEKEGLAQEPGAFATELSNAVGKALEPLKAQGGDITPLAGALADYLNNTALPAKVDAINSQDTVLRDLGNINSIDGQPVTINQDVRSSLANKLDSPQTKITGALVNKYGELEYLGDSGQNTPAFDTNGPSTTTQFGLVDGRQLLETQTADGKSELVKLPKSFAAFENWLSSDDLSISDPNALKVPLLFAHDQDPQGFEHKVARKLAEFERALDDPSTPADVKSNFGDFLKGLAQYAKLAPISNENAVTDLRVELRNTLGTNHDEFFADVLRKEPQLHAQLIDAFPNIALEASYHSLKTQVSLVGELRRSAIDQAYQSLNENQPEGLTDKQLLKALTETDTSGLTGPESEEFHRYLDLAGKLNVIYERQNNAFNQSVENRASDATLPDGSENPDGHRTIAGGVDDADIHRPVTHETADADTHKTKNQDTTAPVSDDQTDTSTPVNANTHRDIPYAPSETDGATGELSDAQLQTFAKSQAAANLKTISQGNQDLLENLSPDLLAVASGDGTLGRLIKTLGGTDALSVGAQLKRRIAQGDADHITDAELRDFIDISVGAKVQNGVKLNDALGQTYRETQSVLGSLDDFTDDFTDKTSFNAFAARYSQSVIDYVSDSNHIPRTQPIGVDNSESLELKRRLLAGHEALGPEAYNDSKALLDNHLDLLARQGDSVTKKDIESDLATENVEQRTVFAEAGFVKEGPRVVPYKILYSSEEDDDYIELDGEELTDGTVNESLLASIQQRADAVAGDGNTVNRLVVSDADNLNGIQRNALTESGALVGLNVEFTDNDQPDSDQDYGGEEETHKSPASVAGNDDQATLDKVREVLGKPADGEKPQLDSVHQSANAGDSTAAQRNELTESGALKGPVEFTDGDEIDGKAPASPPYVVDQYGDLRPAGNYDPAKLIKAREVLGKTSWQVVGDGNKQLHVYVDASKLDPDEISDILLTNLDDIIKTTVPQGYTIKDTNVVVASDIPSETLLAAHKEAAKTDLHVQRFISRKLLASRYDELNIETPPNQPVTQIDKLSSVLHDNERVSPLRQVSNGITDSGNATELQEVTNLAPEAPADEAHLDKAISAAGQEDAVQNLEIRQEARTLGEKLQTGFNQLKTQEKLGEGWLPDFDTVKETEDGKYELTVFKKDSKETKVVTTDDKVFLEAKDFIDSNVKTALEGFKPDSSGTLVPREDATDVEGVSGLNAAFAIQALIGFFQTKSAEKLNKDPDLAKVLKAHEFVNFARIGYGLAQDGIQTVKIARKIVNSTEEAASTTFAEAGGATLGVVGTVAGGGVDVALSLASAGFDIYELTKAQTTAEKAIYGTQLALDSSFAALGGASIGLGIAAAAGSAAAGAAAAALGPLAVVGGGIAVGISGLVQVFSEVAAKADQVADYFDAINKGYKNGGFEYKADSDTLVPLTGAVVTNVDLRNHSVTFGTQTIHKTYGGTGDGQSKLGHSNGYLFSGPNEDFKQADDLDVRTLLKYGKYAQLKDPDAHVLVAPITPTAHLSQNYDNLPGSTGVGKSAVKHGGGYDVLRNAENKDFTYDYTLWIGPIPVETAITSLDYTYDKTAVNINLDSESRVIAIPDIPKEYVGKVYHNIHGDGGRYVLSLNDHADINAYNDKPSNWILEYGNVDSKHISIDSNHVRIGSAVVDVHNHGAHGDSGVFLTDSRTDLYEVNFNSRRTEAILINGENVGDDKKPNGVPRADLTQHLHNLARDGQLREYTTIANYHDPDGKVHAQVYYDRDDKEYLYGNDVPAEADIVQVIQADGDKPQLAVFLDRKSHELIEVNTKDHTTYQSYTLPQLAGKTQVESVDASKGLILNVHQTLDNGENVDYVFRYADGGYALSAISGDTELYNELASGSRTPKEALNLRFKSPVVLDNVVRIGDKGEKPIFLDGDNASVANPHIDGASDTLVQVIHDVNNSVNDNVVVSDPDAFLKGSVYLSYEPITSLESAEKAFDDHASQHINYTIDKLDFNEHNTDGHDRSLNEFLGKNAHLEWSVTAPHKNAVHEIEGRIYLSAGDHQFTVHHDDGLRLKVGNTELINAEKWDQSKAQNVTFHAAEAGYYNINALYYEGRGNSQLSVNIDGKSLDIDDFEGPLKGFTERDNLVVNGRFDDFNQLRADEDQAHSGDAKGWKGNVRGAIPVGRQLDNDFGGGGVFAHLDELSNRQGNFAYDKVNVTSGFGAGGNKLELARGNRIHQDIKTEPGKTYVLRFDQAALSAAGSAEIWWNGKRIATEHVDAIGKGEHRQWNIITLQVTATGDKSTLEFRGAQNSLIDNVGLFKGDKATYDEAYGISAQDKSPANNDGTPLMFYDPTKGAVYTQNGTDPAQQVILGAANADISQKIDRATNTAQGLIVSGDDGLNWRIDNQGNSHLIDVGAKWVNAHPDWLTDFRHLVNSITPSDGASDAAGLLSIAGQSERIPIHGITQQTESGKTEHLTGWYDTASDSFVIANPTPNADSAPDTLSLIRVTDAGKTAWLYDGVAKLLYRQDLTPDEYGYVEAADLPLGNRVPDKLQASSNGLQVTDTQGVTFDLGAHSAQITAVDETWLKRAGDTATDKLAALGKQFLIDGTVAIDTDAGKNTGQWLVPATGEVLDTRNLSGDASNYHLLGVDAQQHLGYLINEGTADSQVYSIKLHGYGQSNGKAESPTEIGQFKYIQSLTDSKGNKTLLVEANDINKIASLPTLDGVNSLLISSPLSSKTSITLDNKLLDHYQKVSLVEPQTGLNGADDADAKQQPLTINLGGNIDVDNTLVSRTGKDLVLYDQSNGHSISFNQVLGDDGTYTDKHPITVNIEGQTGLNLAFVAKDLATDAQFHTSKASSVQLSDIYLDQSLEGGSDQLNTLLHTHDEQTLGFDGAKGETHSDGDDGNLQKITQAIAAFKPSGEIDTDDEKAHHHKKHIPGITDEPDGGHGHLDH